MRKMIAVFVFALLCVPLAAVAGYEAVGATYRPVATGYEVSFVVHNQFYYSWDIVEFGVYATDDRAATSASGPAGWRTYKDPRCGIEWEASSSAYYIKPGCSVGGFCYTTAQPPGTLDYFVRLTTGQVTGMSVTPVLVPEPSSIAALGGGVMGLLALRKRRR